MRRIISLVLVLAIAACTNTPMQATDEPAAPTATATLQVTCDDFSCVDLGGRSFWMGGELYGRIWWEVTVFHVPSEVTSGKLYFIYPDGTERLWGVARTESNGALLDPYFVVSSIAPRFEQTDGWAPSFKVEFYKHEKLLYTTVLYNVSPGATLWPNPFRGKVSDPYSP